MTGLDGSIVPAGTAPRAPVAPTVGGRYPDQPCGVAGTNHRPRRPAAPASTSEPVRRPCPTLLTLRPANHTGSAARPRQRVVLHRTCSGSTASRRSGSGLSAGPGRSRSAACQRYADAVMDAMPERHAQRGGSGRAGPRQMRAVAVPELRTAPRSGRPGLPRRPTESSVVNRKVPRHGGCGISSSTAVDMSTGRRALGQLVRVVSGLYRVADRIDRGDVAPRPKKVIDTSSPWSADRRRRWRNRALIMSSPGSARLASTVDSREHDVLRASATPRILARTASGTPRPASSRSSSGIRTDPNNE
jgi:hypothetical protein